MYKSILTALRNTILTCATTHLIILAVVSVVNRDLSLINGFRILQIDLFFPGLSQGVANFIFSYVLIGGILVFYYFRSSRSK